MRKLHETAAILREILQGEFQTVRLSAGLCGEQFRAEVEAMHPVHLPGVIVVFDRSSLSDGDTVRECRFSLLLVDRFIAGSDERALSLLEAADRLQDLFPVHGRKVDGVVFFPDGCVIPEMDSQCACMQFKLIVKQGI